MSVQSKILNHFITTTRKGRKMLLSDFDFCSLLLVRRIENAKLEISLDRFSLTLNGSFQTIISKQNLSNYTYVFKSEIKSLLGNNFDCWKWQVFPIWLTFQNTFSFMHFLRNHRFKSQTQHILS